MPDNEFTSAALIGHLIGCNLLAKLVDRGVILAKDAASLVDESIIQLEEYESSFPENQKIVNDVRLFLTILLKEYHTDELP
jgi:hypothetical protein